MSDFFIILNGNLQNTLDCIYQSSKHLRLATSRGETQLKVGLTHTDIWTKLLLDSADKHSLSTILASANSAVKHRYWLCVELVTYSAGMNDIFVKRLGDIIAPESTEQYLCNLKEIFHEYTILSVPNYPNLFLLGVDEDPRIETVHPIIAETKPCSVSLPKGHGANQWIAKMNETQMSFHLLNESRKTSINDININGIWLWGEGCHSEIKKNTLAIFTENTETEAMADALDLKRYPTCELSDHLEIRSATAVELTITENNQHGLQLEKIILSAIKSLKSTHIRQLKLLFSDRDRAAEITLNHRSVYKIWRRKTSSHLIKHFSTQDG